MDTLPADVEKLEEAMRLFFQTMKRPQRWACITAQASVNIDRPAATILHLLMLRPAQACHVQDLALQLGIEAPSVTRKTQELEQVGYLERVRDPLDKRAIGLKVTALGRTVGNRLWKAQRGAMQQMLSGWPASDRQQFVALFQRFSSDLAEQYANLK